MFDDINEFHHTFIAKDYMYQDEERNFEHTHALVNRRWERNTFTVCYTL